MTDFKTENKLGVGEILICNKDTRGKFESLKYFIGKVIINIGGGGEKIYIIEEKDKISCEVKSIQSRGNFKSLMNTMYNNILQENLEEENNMRELSRTEIGNSIQGKDRNNRIELIHFPSDQNKIEKNEIKINTSLMKETSIISEADVDKDILRKRDESIVKENSIIKDENSKINRTIQEEHEKSEITSVNNNINLSHIKREDSKEKLKGTIKDFSRTNNNMNGNDPAQYPTMYKDKNFNYIRENNVTEINTRAAGKTETNLNDPSNTLLEISEKTKYASIADEKKSMVNTERENQVIQIVKGKYHTLKLTIDGMVYGSGQSYFGVIGLGGNRSSEKSKLLPNLANIKISQIACGMFHSLALSEIGDLYAWGMGFEGQLGLNNEYKIASSPRYLNFFYKIPIKFITCGHNYSLCITKDYRLWGWGENKLGQLGLGKTQIVDKPTHIVIYDTPGNQEGITTAESFMGINNERHYTNQPLRPTYVSAGFAHTAVVTEEGYLATFGLNIYGQLGLGNTTSTFTPRLIEKCDNGSDLGRISKAFCSTNGTFIITHEGKLYSCGSGEIGHGEIGVMKLPRIVSETRIFQHIFCNDNSVVAFCPLRIVSISPNCGPATGNTILSIIGSAFKDFSKLSVRFIFGGIARVLYKIFIKKIKILGC